jgi:catechol 2,3-dioxygenase-like lactoylglutathione lyase family enzyme
MSVKDMERSLAFYRDALGLELVIDGVVSGQDVDRGFMETGAIVRSVMLADEAGNMIQLLGWQSPQVRERPPEHLKYSSTGLVEICLQVNDLEKLRKDLEEKGFRFRILPYVMETNEFKVKLAHLSDPDGVALELMQV